MYLARRVEQTSAVYTSYTQDADRIRVTIIEVTKRHATICYCYIYADFFAYSSFRKLINFMVYVRARIFALTFGINF